MSLRLPPLSVLLAIGLACLLLVWLALGDIEGFRDTPPEEKEAEGPALTRVEVVERQASVHSPQLTLQGQLEAHRELELRARQAGRVTGLPVAVGSRVADGQVLLELDRDELPQRLEQAEAELALAQAELAGGEVTHVASRADEATRSFAVEVGLDNPEHRRLAGASATLEITLPERRVHRLSPALLELDDQGKLAVKHLDDDDRVRLDRVELVDADAREARVAGLPERIRLITLGGGFVSPGETVIAVPVDSASTDEATGSGFTPTTESP